MIIKNNIYAYTYTYNGLLKEKWQVPYKDEFNGWDMTIENHPNWRPYMYFDGDIIGADYFGNVNLAYLGTLMGLPEWVWNNFTTRDMYLDIKAMEQGRRIALLELSAEK